MREVDIHNVRIYIRDYFDIRELVSPPVYKKYGDDAWAFFDPRLLVNLYYIRKLSGCKITINDWLWGGKFKQRGLRSNLSYIVKGMVQKGRLYLSGHIRGTAVDFDVEGYSAFDFRIWLIKNQSKLPYKFRCEDKVNWVHLDIDDYEKNPHFYMFKA